MSYAARFRLRLKNHSTTSVFNHLILPGDHSNGTGKSGSFAYRFTVARLKPNAQAISFASRNSGMSDTIRSPDGSDRIVGKFSELWVSISNFSNA